MGWLVLARKREEKIRIVLPDGRVIHHVTLENRDGKTRHGFLAPDDVKIFREEVWERLQAGKPSPARPPGVAGEPSAPEERKAG